MAGNLREFRRLLSPPAEAYPLFVAVGAALGAVGYFRNKLLTNTTARGVEFKATSHQNATPWHGSDRMDSAQ